MFWTAALVLGLATSSTAQTANCRPTVASLRSLALSTWDATHDGDRVLAALDAQLGPYGNDWAQDIDYARREGLSFAVFIPSRTYRSAVADALRKREPLAAVPVNEAVVISVGVMTMDAPNIEKVIVERNGKVVLPIGGSLRPQTFTNRMNAKTVRNDGALLYPCSAFMPGAEVVVTGIPSAGDNFERRFTSDELADLNAVTP